jgi:hypothetical protein
MTQSVLVTAVPPFIAPEQYSHVRAFLSLSVPKIVFIHSSVFDSVFQTSTCDHETTLLLPYSDSSLYLNNRFINPEKVNPDSNIDQMIFQCSKPEFMRFAVSISPSTSSSNTHFVWLDIWLRADLETTSESRFAQLVETLAQQSHGLSPRKVRVGEIWNLDYPFPIDLMRSRGWYFSESIFGGGAEGLVKFADEMKRECERIVEEHRTVTWLSNVMYLVYKRVGEDMFSVYGCTMNERMIEKYTDRAIS